MVFEYIWRCRIVSCFISLIAAYVELVQAGLWYVLLDDTFTETPSIMLRDCELGADLSCWDPSCRYCNCCPFCYEANKCFVCRVSELDADVSYMSAKYP